MAAVFLLEYDMYDKKHLRFFLNEWYSPNDEIF